MRYVKTAADADPVLLSEDKFAKAEILQVLGTDMMCGSGRVLTKPLVVATQSYKRWYGVSSTSLELPSSDVHTMLSGSVAGQLASSSWCSAAAGAGHALLIPAAHAGAATARQGACTWGVASRADTVTSRKA